MQDQELILARLRAADYGIERVTGTQTRKGDGTMNRFRAS